MEPPMVILLIPPSHVKPEFIDAAQFKFNNSNINITFEGHRYLGSPIGSDSFI